MEIFEKASRLKLRFESTKGLLDTEELWGLKLTDLDTLAKGVNKKLKEESEESFISTKTTNNTKLQLQLDILKRVIEVKMKEADDAITKAERSEELQVLKQLLTDKKLAEMQNLSSEEIAKRIAELQA
jgi:hypothetical protein